VSSRTPGPPARRPGHASRLRDEAERITEARRERKAQARHRRMVGLRIAILAMVALGAFVVTFPALRAYVDQRRDLVALQQEAAEAHAATDNLQAELDRWDDPAFVEAQARERLGFVMPGDIAFKVVDAEKVPALAPAPRPAPSASMVVDPQDPSAPGDPWYTKLERSILSLGRQPATPDDASPPSPDPPIP